MIINISVKELDTLQYWVTEKIQEIFDDPSSCDNVLELECYLTHLRNICTSLKLDYLVIARREASSFEIREMRNILPNSDLVPKDR